MAKICRIDFGVGNYGSNTELAKKYLHEEGYFVAKNLINNDLLRKTRKYISNLIFQLSKANGLPTAGISAGEDFDQGLQKICEKDRNLAGVIYRACRRLTPVHTLSCDENILKLSEAIMETEYIVSSNLKAIRIDHPNEDKYLFDLHQDYPYIQDSLNAIIYWIPLRKVEEKEGALRIFPTTHRLGLKKVKVIDSQNNNKNGAHTIELAEKDELSCLPSMLVPVEFGECIVFSTLVLHQSTGNKSSKHRWTIQIRQGDFNCPNAIARQWPGGMIENDGFEKYHSDFIME